MKRYVVKSPLRHDGKRHETGSTVELSDDVARTLIERRRIALVPPTFPVRTDAPAKPASPAAEPAAASTTTETPAEAPAKPAAQRPKRAKSEE